MWLWVGIGICWVAIICAWVFYIIPTNRKTAQIRRDSAYRLSLRSVVVPGSRPVQGRDENAH